MHFRDGFNQKKICLTSNERMAYFIGCRSKYRYRAHILSWQGCFVELVSEQLVVVRRMVYYVYIIQSKATSS